MNTYLVSLAGGALIGLARLSPRSLAAVVTSMAFAAATVILVRHGWPS